MTEKREVEPGRDPVTAKLLELLYLSRKRKGWTVRDLAAEAGVSPSYVSLIENGHKVPDAGTMERIGRALEIEPGLLHAWVTVQSRGTDVASSVDAAHRLMASLELYPDATGSVPGVVASRMPPRGMYDRMDAAMMVSPVAATELPVPARYVLGVVMAEEGREPTEDEVRDTDRRVWIDRRALPERDVLRGAFAWRLSREGLARVTGLYRRGDLVVIARDVWEPDAIHPRQVYAVRFEGRVVLSRIAWT
ncbi:MAG: helix-turn-helix transcriptional regulator, partial [Gemmatimonadales bacterium]|nr:helix-turn-helix transcriptional regulator [Gemmatimonadales bacterium]